MMSGVPTYSSSPTSTSNNSLHNATMMTYGNNNASVIVPPHQRRRKISVIRVLPTTNNSYAYATATPTTSSPLAGGVQIFEQSYQPLQPLTPTTSATNVPTPLTSQLPPHHVYNHLEGSSTAPVQIYAQPPSFPTVTASNIAGTISSTTPSHATEQLDKATSGGSSTTNPAPSSPTLKASTKFTSQSVADLPSRLSEIFKSGSSNNAKNSSPVKKDMGQSLSSLTSMKLLAKSCADLRSIDDVDEEDKETKSAGTTSKDARGGSLSATGTRLQSPTNSPLLSPSNKFHFPTTPSSFSTPGVGAEGGGSRNPLELAIMEKRVKQALMKSSGRKSPSKPSTIGHSASGGTSFTIPPQAIPYRASVLGSPPLTRASKFIASASDIFHNSHSRSSQGGSGQRSRSRADSSISDSEDEGFPTQKYSKSAVTSPRLSPTKMRPAGGPVPGGVFVDDPSSLLKAKLKHTHSLSNLPDTLMKESRKERRAKVEDPVSPTKSRVKDVFPGPLKLPPSEPVPMPKESVYYTVHGGLNNLFGSARALRRFDDSDRIDCDGDLLDESYEDMLEQQESGNSFEEGFCYPLTNQQQHGQHFYYPFTSSGGSGSSYHNSRRSGSPSSGYKTMGPFPFPTNHYATISSNTDPTLAKYLIEKERLRQQQYQYNKYYGFVVRKKIKECKKNI